MVIEMFERVNQRYEIIEDKGGHPGIRKHRPV